jgi:hypothetical protein
MEFKAYINASNQFNASMLQSTPVIDSDSFGMDNAIPPLLLKKVIKNLKVFSPR